MKIARLLVLLLIVNIVLTGCQFALTIFRASDSVYLGQLRGQLKQIQLAINNLEVQTTELMTHESITQRAEQLKLARGKVDFVVQTHEVALKVH